MAQWQYIQITDNEETLAVLVIEMFIVFIYNSLTSIWGKMNSHNTHLIVSAVPLGRLRFHYVNDNEYENDIFVCWHHHFLCSS